MSLFAVGLILYNSRSYAYHANLYLGIPKVDIPQFRSMHGFIQERLSSINYELGTVVQKHFIWTDTVAKENCSHGIRSQVRVPN